MSVYIHLLDNGMVTDAKEVEMIMNEVISDNQNASDLSEDQNKRIKKLVRVVKSIGSKII